MGKAFLEHADLVEDALLGGNLSEPARRFVQIFKGEPEGAIMHWHEPSGAKVPEDFDGLVGSHVQVAEGLRMVSADGQEGDFGPAVLTDLLKAVEIGAVAGVVDAATLVF